MRYELREGLTLTRCDVCNVRRFCAVTGTAMCEQCCPGAVEMAREEAAERRMDRQAARDASSEEAPCGLPPEEDDPTDPVPFREVAHIAWPEWYAAP